MTSPAALIGIDWGTSNFRAFLLDSAGTMLDRRAGPNGIMSVPDGKFAQVLAAGIGDWLAEGRLPIVMSGMIGSRQGWVEAPYVATPLGIEDLAAGLVRAPFDAADARIVPGLRTTSDDSHDVIRGEETQIFGALASLGIEGGRFLLPGTHSKWAVVEGSRITSFATYMTGEIFSAARGHTILGRLMQEGTPKGEAFLRGVAYGAWPGSPGALLHRLFGVRTAGLFGEVDSVDLSDYLSGLLIGAEIADQSGRDNRPVHIIASDALAERYRAAASSLGVTGKIVPSDSIVGGYMALAKIAGLLSA